VRTLDGVQEAVTFPLPKGLDGQKVVTAPDTV